MPRERSIKQLFGETVIFISMFALAGHLSINFWEKYVIQSELSHMKSSLHSMKITINKIGNAYDALHKELKCLKQFTNNKPQLKEPVHRHKNTYNKKTRNDVEVNALVAEKYNKSSLTPKTEERNIDNTSKQHLTLCNATTITRYPLKSTNVGSDLESAAGEENCRYIVCDNKLRNCYKQCAECQPTQNH